MIRLRASFRMLALAVLTFGGFASLIVILPLRRLAPGRHLRLRNGVFRIWGRNMLRALGVRTTVRGTPPDGGSFLVSNHLSYLDITLLGANVDVAFVAKSELRSWPIAGTIIAAADTVFIDRSRRRDLVRVIRDVENVLDRGLGVIVFAEGTTSNGASILPLKPSILELPARAGHPVSHATISYRLRSGQPAGDTVCWWGDTPFPPHVWKLAKQSGVDATLTFGDEPITAPDRKALASALHAAMDSNFEPVP